MPVPKTPKVTVDIVIELVDHERSPIVLIERKFPPFGWALPGGFVDIGEPVESAAIREAEEETGLQVKLECLLGCYSDPSRDERGHTVSIVYVGQATGTPVAQDDAKNVALYRPEDLPPLAFDHALILSDYCAFRETGQPAPIRHLA